jgi:NAD(P)-dependent dehydrogenase (short-subunit alcohol dehydrogenase family)
MQVMVTGSSGKVGRATAEALRVAVHEVTGADLKGGMEGGIRTIACDCTDFGQVLGLMTGVDTASRPEAVVHLAGIPVPGLATMPRRSGLTPSGTTTCSRPPPGPASSAWVGLKRNPIRSSLHDIPGLRDSRRRASGPPGMVLLAQEKGRRDHRG